MNMLIAALLLAAASTYQATSALAPTVRDLSPAPGTTVKAFFPRLSATIDTRGTALVRRQLHVYVDGHDVTAAAALSGNTVTYTPRQHMNAGWHDVFLEGSDAQKHTFSEAWVFRTQDPDIDLPIEDGSFAFSPIGLQSGPFTHFFFVSPFDGLGLVQFCGLQFPMTQVVGAPVFFVTVPVTLGTVLLGCNPGVVFTPFQAQFGQTTPIFVPIVVAGPSIFNNGGERRRRPLMPGMTAPVNQTQSLPVNRTQPLPIYRTQPLPSRVNREPMPVNRAPMPVNRAPMPVIIRVPHCCTHVR